MESARMKSLGTLIDELITVSHKCWDAQEVLKDSNVSDEVVAENFKRAQILNDRRNRLIRAIDEVVGDLENSPSEKTYHTYFGGNK